MTPLRLADFIEANIEPILAEWVTFARTRIGADDMDVVALRDHAAEMLAIVVTDLRTPQSPLQQFTKSYGDAESDACTPDSAAETHGAGRAVSGYSVSEMVSEFRALRASVLRLWTASRGSLDSNDLQDLMRFNEAIDQALAESMTRFTRSLDQSQDMFVAILGHDLRTPLQTMLMVTQHMVDTGAADAAHTELLARAVRSAHRMNEMIDDLLDFTRSRLGSGVVIEPRETDLTIVAREAVEEMEVAYPDRTFVLECHGECTGRWDAARIRQVLANLLGNAVQHGHAAAPIVATVRGEAESVVLEVRNHGPVIPSSAMSGLFSPFKRLHGVTAPSTAHNLGLGLYIADRIVHAHGGDIAVTSSERDGTCFAVRLPRERQQER